MRTSYNKSNLKYEDIFKLLIWLNKPEIIVEFGILDGYSLRAILSQCDNKCEVQAYDIFDDFVGNHANYKKITEQFSNYSNCQVLYGDFYKKWEDFDDSTIDLLHIDIANDGTVYAYMLDKYWPKMKKGGIVVMEGGSEERDNVEWMQQYKKVKINDFLKSLNKGTYDFEVIDKFPAVTIFKKW